MVNPAASRSIVHTVLVVAFAAALGCADTPRAPVLQHNAATLTERSADAAFAALPAAEYPGRVQLLPKNSLAWAERWRLLEQATQSIDVTYFIVEPDAFGLALLGRLMERASEGLRVRLLVDNRGTLVMNPDALDAVAGAGVEVRVYNPMAMNVMETLASGKPSTIMASNHDKITLIDGEKAVLGGRNVSRDYMVDDDDHLHSYRDVDFVVEGPVAKDVKAAFDIEMSARRSVLRTRDRVDFVDPGPGLRLCARAMDAWLRAEPPAPLELSSWDPSARALELAGAITGAQPEIPSDRARDTLRRCAEGLAGSAGLRGALRLPHTLPVVEGAVVRILDTQSSEGTGGNVVNYSLATMLEGTTGDVFVMTPYLVLTTVALDAMKRAAARGVRFTFLTNSPTSSDNMLTQALFVRMWPEVLAQVPGARVFALGDDQLLHGKVGVFDGRVTMLGSYNLDLLSAKVNGEITAAVWSPDFARQNLDVIEGLIARGEPDVYEYRIARDVEGKPLRHPAGHKDAGRVVVAFGHENHCKQEQIDAVGELVRAVDRGRDLPMLRDLMR